MKKPKKSVKNREKQKTKMTKEIVVEIDDIDDLEETDPEAEIDRTDFQTFFRQQRFFNPSLVQSDIPIENLEEDLSLLPSTPTVSDNNSGPVSYSQVNNNVYNINPLSPESLLENYSSGGVYSGSDPNYSFLMKTMDPIESGKEMNLKSFIDQNSGYPGGDRPQNSGDNYISAPLRRETQQETLPFEEKKKQ